VSRQSRKGVAVSTIQFVNPATDHVEDRVEPTDHCHGINLTSSSISREPFSPLKGNVPLALHTKYHRVVSFTKRGLL
jgi:hypothetical protein